MSKKCSYFLETPPRDYSFFGFYKYRQQQSDFTFSFRKEALKLKNDLNELMNDDSEEVKTAVSQLLHNYKVSNLYISFSLAKRDYATRRVHCTPCSLMIAYSSYITRFFLVRTTTVDICVLFTLRLAYPLCVRCGQPQSLPVLFLFFHTVPSITIRIIAKGTMTSGYFGMK